MTNRHPKQQAQPILASTIMPIRDTEKGLQVFMAVRSQKASFFPGAWVFPGGKIEEDDAPHLWDNLYQKSQLSANELQIRIGAIRELFEETSLLLAYDQHKTNEQTFINQDEIRYRGNEVKSSHLRDLLKENNWYLASEHLEPFAHWITPKAFSKRYDTYFFLAVAPKEQKAIHDGTELTDSTWCYPDEMLQRVKNGIISMIFPTKLNLMKLSLAKNTTEAIKQAQETKKITIVPELIKEKEQFFLEIPKESNYPISRELFKFPK